MEGKNSNRKLGGESENLSSKFLTEHGYTIIKKNFFKRSCEIDIIATKNKIITFVEVKSSSNLGIDSLEDLIDKKKRINILRCSLKFLEENPKYDSYQTSYDVIFVNIKTQKIEHIQNAIEFDESELETLGDLDF